MGKPTNAVPTAPEGKTLMIELIDKNAPTYTFTGQWGGRDIMVVARTIVRAHRKRQLASRRGLSDLTIAPSEGVTNG